MSHRIKLSRRLLYPSWDFGVVEIGYPHYKFGGSICVLCISITFHSTVQVILAYLVEYTPVHFNFKIKKIQFGKEMTVEIMLNDL
jgi:hypothetical protein